MLLLGQIICVHMHTHSQTLTRPHALVHTNHPRPHSHTHLRTWLLACNICTAICVLNVNWMLESADRGIVLISIPINPSHDKVFIRRTNSHGLHIPQQWLYTSFHSHLSYHLPVLASPPTAEEPRSSRVTTESDTRVHMLRSD